jgi:hypothetical protein
MENKNEIEKELGFSLTSMVKTLARVLRKSSF